MPRRLTESFVRNNWFPAFQDESWVRTQVDELRRGYPTFNGNQLMSIFRYRQHRLWASIYLRSLGFIVN